jgi:hypothetical protein
MAERPLAEKIGATPGKLVLVGVLGVIFLGVIASQFLGGDAADLAASAAPRVPARRLPRHIAPQPTGEAPPAQAAVARPWPVISLAQALAHDPFAQPAISLESDPSIPSVSQEAASAAGQDERRAALERLQALRAAAIAITPNGPVATVGTDVWRVGDRIEGFRVTNIDLMGITLVDERSSANAQ